MSAGCLEELKPCLTWKCNQLSVHAGLGWLTLRFKDATVVRIRDAGRLRQFRDELGSAFRRPVHDARLVIEPDFCGLRIVDDYAAALSLNFETSPSPFYVGREMGILRDLHHWLLVQDAAGRQTLPAVHRAGKLWRIDWPGTTTVRLLLRRPQRLLRACLDEISGREPAIDRGEMFFLASNTNATRLCAAGGMPVSSGISRTELVLLAMALHKALTASRPKH